MKPILARGEISVIGATTIDEYRKYIEKDTALERRFSPVTIEEPSIKDTITMLQGIRDKYENHHNVRMKQLMQRLIFLLDIYLIDFCQIKQ